MMTTTLVVTTSLSPFTSLTSLLTSLFLEVSTVFHPPSRVVSLFCSRGLSLPSYTPPTAKYKETGSSHLSRHQPDAVT